MLIKQNISIYFLLYFCTLFVLITFISKNFDHTSQ